MGSEAEKGRYGHRNRERKAQHFMPRAAEEKDKTEPLLGPGEPKDPDTSHQRQTVGSGTERQGDRARDRRQEREEPPENRAKDPRQTQRDTQRPEVVETHGLRAKERYMDRGSG